MSRQENLDKGSGKEVMDHEQREPPLIRGSGARVVGFSGLEVKAGVFICLDL